MLQASCLNKNLRLQAVCGNSKQRTKMQRRTNKLWEQSTKALSGQQRNKKVTRVVKPH